MKKYLWIILLLSVLIIGGIIYFYNLKSEKNFNYSVEKTNINNSIINTSKNDNANNTIATTPKPPQEVEISAYSTVIKNKRDTNRQGNITITCSTLNNKIVKSGEIFSFCDTVGESTIERGYKEANVIIQGTEVKGLGGGNCQVSSTLYNAVLAVRELEVIERHPHSAPVPYIEKGKDAAVSYGAHDFKFKNNTNSDIKIIATNTADNITIKLLKID